MWLDERYQAGEWEKQAAEIKALLQEHSVANEPCGTDVHFGVNTVDYLRKAGINVVDGNPAMAEARMIKNVDEIECCRIAGTIVESAQWEVCKALRPGVTELQMAGVAAKAVFDLGAEELEGPNFILSSGPRFGHYGVQTGTDRVVRPGELFVIDINGVSFQGYRTCFYRTYCVGDKPTERQKDVYQACYDILSTMEQSIKPGKTNHDYARAVLEKGGGRWVGNLTFEGKKWGPTWPEPGRYFSPGGHMLGLASGDPGPSIGKRHPHLDAPPFTFQPGMVIAVEVGVRDWDGSEWLYDGVKLENTGVVTDTGFEIFYRFPYKDLITVGLRGCTSGPSRKYLVTQSVATYTVVGARRERMAPPQKAALRAMTVEEQAALERLTKSSSERLDRVRWATALLAIREGEALAAAARQAGFRSSSAVAALVERFNQRGLGALKIAPGRGRKPTYDPTARAQIVATAQRAPDRKMDGTATWSLSSLERRLRRDAYPRIGRTTIQRVLESAGSSYQKARTWCPTGTAQRKRKAGVVTVVDPQTEEKRG